MIGQQLSGVWPHTIHLVLKCISVVQSRWTSTVASPCQPSLLRIAWPWFSSVIYSNHCTGAVRAPTMDIKFSAGGQNSCEFALLRELLLAFWSRGERSITPLLRCMWIGKTFNVVCEHNAPPTDLRNGLADWIPIRPHNKGERVALCTPVHSYG